MSGSSLRRCHSGECSSAQLLDLVLREIAERAAPARYARVPASGASVPADRFQERGLAGAVGAQEPDAVAGENAEVESLEHRRPALVTERRVLEQDELPRGGRGRREGELERAVDVRRGDELHALERLDAALRLLRLGGLRAEAVDERLQMRDLPLLLGVRRLLQRELLRALALELRVVAGVGDELAVVDVHDACRPRRRGSRGRA